MYKSSVCLLRCSTVRFVNSRPLELFLRKTTDSEAKKLQRNSLETKNTDAGRAIQNLLFLDQKILERHRHHWANAAEDLIQYIPLLSKREILSVMNICSNVRSPHFKVLVDKLLGRIVGEIGVYDTSHLVYLYPLFSVWVDQVSEIRLRILERACVPKVVESAGILTSAEATRFCYALAVNEGRRLRQFEEMTEIELQRTEKFASGGELFFKDPAERQKRIELKSKQFQEQYIQQSSQENDSIVNPSSTLTSSWRALTHDQARVLLAACSRLPENSGGVVQSPDSLCEMFYCMGWAVQHDWLGNYLPPAEIEDFTSRLRRRFVPHDFADTKLASRITLSQGLLMLNLGDRPAVRDFIKDLMHNKMKNSTRLEVLNGLHRLHALGLWRGGELGEFTNVNIGEVLFELAASWIDKYRRPDREELQWLLEEAISVLSRRAVLPPVVSPMSSGGARGIRGRFEKGRNLERLDLAVEGGDGRRLAAMRNARVFERSPRDESKWSKWGGLEMDARRKR